MKYHYKTPEEALQAQEEIHTKHSFFKNRSNKIILLDILILCVIFSVVYFSGILEKSSLLPTDPIQHGPFAYSAAFTHEWKHHGKRLEVAAYLNIRNTTDQELSFPLYESKAKDALQKAIVQIQFLENKTEFPISLDTRKIQSGQTLILHGNMTVYREISGPIPQVRLQCRLIFPNAKKWLRKSTKQ